MKSTGIIRRMDDLGRIVLPKELRRQMKINEGDALEIFTDKGSICLRKYSPIGELDMDSMKIICDSALGALNYTIYNVDGEAIMPNVIGESNFVINENTAPITAGGELLGYVQSPSGNRTVVADILGGLLVS